VSWKLTPCACVSGVGARKRKAYVLVVKRAFNEESMDDFPLSRIEIDGVSGPSLMLYYNDSYLLSSKSEINAESISKVKRWMASI
jgi:hypothetical protein